VRGVRVATEFHREQSQSKIISAGSLGGIAVALQQAVQRAEMPSYTTGLSSDHRSALFQDDRHRGKRELAIFEIFVGETQHHDGPILRYELLRALLFCGGTTRSD
jgi:hypothetical protein